MGCALPLRCLKRTGPLISDAIFFDLFIAFWALYKNYICTCVQIQSAPANRLIQPPTTVRASVRATITRDRFPAGSHGWYESALPFSSSRTKSSPQLMPAFFWEPFDPQSGLPRYPAVQILYGKSVEVERCTKSSINIDQHRDLIALRMFCTTCRSSR